jgi:hypothetical protein
MAKQGWLEMEIPEDGTHVRATEPLIWVKEFRVYERWDDPDPLRSIPLRRGLNVIWSHRTDENTNGGVSGHSAGKTTFCRLLRFLLGEESFGDSELHKRIRTRLPTGWVVGEIFVNGTPWVVRRHFGLGRKRDGAARDRCMDSLKLIEFESGSFAKFMDVLRQALAEGTPPFDLPGRVGKVGWENVLPWLTRDQECRLDGLASWRDAASNSHVPEYNVAINSFIVRSVLGLVDRDELPERQKLEGLRRNEKKLATDIVRLEHSNERTAERLNTALGLTQEAGMEELSWQARREALDKRVENLRETADDLPEVSAYNALDRRHQMVLATKEQIKGRLDREEELLKRDQDNHKAVVGEHRQEGLEQEERRGEHAAIGRCDVPLDYARAHGCELARGQVHDLKSDLVIRNLADEKGFWAKQVAKQEAVVQSIKAQLKSTEAQIKELARKRQAAFGQLTRATGPTHAKIAEFQALALRIKEAESEIKSLDAAHQEQRTLLAQIEESEERIAAIRQKAAPIRRAFQRTYREVLTRIIGAETEPAVSFHANRIEISLKYHGNLNSLTIDIVKLLVFDYAALVASINGIGNHPRFLVHDSPKEADMDDAVYAQFFELMGEMEAKQEGPAAFQYIVTTTSPPPEARRESDCVVCELDANQAKTRLLKVDL